jgi:hypothetical protein
MSDPMRKIMKLFLALEEDDKTVQQVHALADDLFHSECRMQVDGQCLKKPRIMADMEGLVLKKIKMELIRVEKDEMGLVYEYTVRKPLEKPQKMVASAMVRDGKIYHVDVQPAEVVSPSAAEKRMRRVSAPVIQIHGF